MRFVVIAVVLVSSSLPGQRRPGISELEARIVALELEVRNLKAENRRLKGLEEKVESLEASLLRLLSGESPATLRAETPAPAPESRPAGLEPFQAMPYGEDRVFLAVAVSERSTCRPDGRVDHRLLVDLVEPPEELIKEGAEAGKQAGEQVPGGSLLLPLDRVKKLPRHRMVIERLSAAGVKRWTDALSPRSILVGGPTAAAFRQLSFARVLASRRQMLSGYEGDSGSIKVWRGEFYWDENNVFFLENGVLKVLGEGTAGHHLRFAGHPGMRRLPRR